MIAMALSWSLLIADERDVTIQGRFWSDAEGEFGISIIMITHDLGVVVGMVG